MSWNPKAKERKLGGDDSMDLALSLTKDLERIG